MNEIRDIYLSGLRAGLFSGCICSSREELAAVACVPVSMVDELMADGTLRPCPAHPQNLVNSPRAEAEIRPILRRVKIGPGFRGGGT